MKRTTAVAAVLAACTLTLTGLGPIEREGDGDRRATLNAMEAKPFPAETLKALGVEPGGVTVVITLNQVAPESLLALRRLSRLEKKFAKDGLKIVGVVDEASWETMQTRQTAGLITSALVLDTDGAIRGALQSDDDPDVYMIDRAGQLRYADVSVDSAVEVIPDLLGETAQDAAGEQARREAAAAAGEDPFGAPKEVTLKDIPASAYADADWPTHNAARNLNAMDRQGKKLPKPLGSETWLSKKDRDPEGHVLVLDFWATWCGPCRASQPKLESLQAKYKDELMVMAIGGMNDPLADVKQYLAQHPHAYYNLYDGHQTLSTALQVQAIPHSVVISTDGVIRWQGNPLDGNFEKVVAQVVKADPYLAAKRDGGVSGSTQGAADTSAVEKAYAAQAWPDHNTGELYAIDAQGRTFDNPFEGVEWLDGDAPDTKGKVTIVDFWATWCGPCSAFSPKLDAIQKRFKDDVVAVGVAGQNDPKDKVMAHVKEHRVSYREAYAADQKLYHSLGVSGIPHVLILSSDGVVRWQGFPGAVEDFQGLVTKIVLADRKARAALDD